jgi:CRISPR-associated protein Cas2
MLHLIAYDISDGKRLRKVARLCEDYGIRVEKSVFECELDNNQFYELWSKLELLACGSDSIIDYPIGLLDRKKIRTLGGAKRYEPQQTYVF